MSLISPIRAVAAILAGGRGTRFHPYTEIIPKPLIPLGSDERPLLEYIVCWLAAHGVRELVILLGHRWKSVINYFRNGDRWCVNIRYSIDDEKYNNTGGALLKAVKNHVLDTNKTILVWYGDIIAMINPIKLLEKHWERGADATLALASRYQVPVGVAKVRESVIEELEEKPWINLNVTIGVLAVEPSVIAEAEKELGTSFDIMGDLVPWLIGRGRKVYAYMYDGAWWDVGSLERYRKLDEKAFEEFFKSCSLIRC